MSAAIIIPARYQSSRLPGKPLLKDTGKTLIQHVFENARLVKNASRIIVATDDERIRDCVMGFGGEAVMTSPTHSSGSARAAEAAETIEAEIIVNLQGDEPEISPAHIDRLIEIQANVKPFASTLACRFPDTARYGPGSPEDPAAVKALLGEEIETRLHWARYFTRVVCPWPRDNNNFIASPSDYFLHVGVYAFSKSSLTRFAQAKSGALETAERLEQLRILEMNEKIAVGVVGEAAPGVDTQQDYAAFVQRTKNGAAGR
ncbi:3-deoxy-manno-octulosonate cytidylyltransferase [Hyphococcus sp.]|uniref:3-deoxy-manno-octulosonate cytidylyltransferase n=1 Tax=Hyphococcus sp. TaxID=2038636 RepID=UPI003CCB749B